MKPSAMSRKICTSVVETLEYFLLIFMYFLVLLLLVLINNSLETIIIFNQMAKIKIIRDLHAKLK